MVIIIEQLMKEKTNQTDKLTELDEVLRASCNALSALWFLFSKSSLDELLGILPLIELLLIACTMLETRPFSVDLFTSIEVPVLGDPTAFSTYFVFGCGSTLCESNLFNLNNCLVEVLSKKV